MNARLHVTLLEATRWHCGFTSDAPSLLSAFPSIEFSFCGREEIELEPSSDWEKGILWMLLISVHPRIKVQRAEEDKRNKTVITVLEAC